ncbi:MAG: hypothetical protein HON48_22310, partial [Desulfobacula sp.]|nr:hypothetical protein [Desulfobacula sp.]
TVRTISGTPDRDDPDNFNTQSDDFFEDLPGAITDINAVAGEMNTVATSIEQDAADAESASTIAVAAANFQGSWSNQTGAAAIPYSVLHDSKYWMLNTGLADVTLKEPGVDVEWTQIGVFDLESDSGPTLGANMDCADKEVKKALFKDTAETTQALGSISSNTAIDLESGNVVTCTIGAALIFTFSNPPATGKTGYLVLEITNGAAYTITWPGAVSWDGGSAPTLQASGVDTLVFYTRDAGTTWRGVRGWKAA